MAETYKLRLTAKEIDEKLQENTEAADFGLVQDTMTGVVYPTYKGERSPNGIFLAAAGEGKDEFKMVNNSGWLTKVIAHGVSCSIGVYWSSVESGVNTGNGSLTVTVNGGVKEVRDVKQGDVHIDVGNYLSTGLNEVAVTISDIYGNSRTITYKVTTVSVSISSYFDDKAAYTGAFDFAYTPVGAIDKTMHFLIDGDEIGTEVVSGSNREKTYTIPAQSHGSHTLGVYFTGEVVDENTGERYPVESNHLHYDVICCEAGNNTPIITTTFKTETIKQYGTAVIQYIVYTPGASTSEIQLKDGDEVVSNLTVDETRHTWAYKAMDAGEKHLSIVCGNTIKPISFDVEKNDMAIGAETNNLELFLTSAGRIPDDDDLDWSYDDIHANMTGFNFKSDGWKSDEDGNTVLRVSGDARVEIPFNIFATDFRGTGKTIEIEFATRDVMNYDAVVLSSWSGERGIKVTAQKAMLKSAMSEIFTQYKEDEHVRVTFCVGKKANKRLLAIYLNGIMSGVVQYPDGDDGGDDFSQSPPVGISIGSKDCTVDIYCIRVYGNDLSSDQIVKNWIADTQDVDTMIDRHLRNDVFDDHDSIAVSKLPADVPYFVINADAYSDLPSGSADKKTISGAYVDPQHPERSFTYEGAEIKIQGTSSAGYYRKNYKISFNGGFTVNGVHSDTYKLREASMPTNTFTFKADVASSEGANNVELAMLYNDACPVKTPPQNMPNSCVRQGIEGYPCLIFYYDGDKHNFIGKYNFNNDKETAEVFGFDENDESWEILTNNTKTAVWKDDNFADDEWKKSFKARYPKNNENVGSLQALATWLKSTDTTAVDTKEEKDARLKKFREEFEDWFNKDAMIFNYIFTELFLMVDNRAKNAFPTRYDEDGKWLILPYDYDTAMGINNNGKLTFGYELEDTDFVDGKAVFNGQDSVLYVNMRSEFADEIKTMYQNLRNTDLFCYEEIERRFEDHQRVWGESIFNEDARFKYIDPLEVGDSSFLPMLLGAKAEQRKWWLYNRFRYLDSKYEAGDSMDDIIQLYAYGVADIEVTPYADIYAAALFDSDMVKERALRSYGSITLANPLEAGHDAVIRIYSASQLAEIGDLSPLKVGYADFSKAIRLSSLKVGSNASGYNNPNMTNLTVGNLTLLKELDVRNCSALKQPVDVSGCTNIERVYFDGTATTGVILPNGGILKTLHLPSTVTNLTILNQKNLTKFVLPSFANVTTLRIENTPIVDTLTAVKTIPDNSRVRLIGFDWTVDTVHDIYALFDKFDTFRGLDVGGTTTDKVVVEGTIHVEVVSEEDLEKFEARYKSVTITYDRIENMVSFIVDGKVISSNALAVGETITVPANPTKESTAKYNYTFSGWSLDGETVATVPDKMGEKNLTFTALFTEELRAYTIRFYSESTLLKSISVAYGSLPVYSGSTPTKASTDPSVSYRFIGWSPELILVNGDADYYADFMAVTSMDTYSWSEISAISEAGTAENYFAVGDAKSVALKGTVGTLELDATYYVYILGFNHNSEIEGNGITFGTFKTAAANGKDICLVNGKYSTTDGTKVFNTNHWGTSNDVNNNGGWAGCDMRYDILGSTDIPPSGYGRATTSGRVGYDPSDNCATTPVANTLMAALPVELRAVMKPMTKYSNNVGGQGTTQGDGNGAGKVTVSIDYLPLLAEFEIFGEIKYANSSEPSKQQQYDYYAAGNSTVKYSHSDTTEKQVWLGRSATYLYGCKVCLTKTDGTQSYGSPSSPYGIAPIFKV